MADEMRQVLKERFQTQDVNEHFYDVTFKIRDNLLHAHRFLLSTVSETFQAMFSKNWNPSSSEPIEIQTCPFETFKKFIAYFYHGVCDFDERDVFDIIDLAEMYQVQPLKNQFDSFLAEMSFTDENIYRLLEISEVYGFQTLKKSLSNYLVGNWETLFEREDFMEDNGNVLMGILGLDRDGIERIENALFVKVFARSQRKSKEKNADFDNLKLEEKQALVKAEMAPFLPKFKFGFRSLDFLNDFVAARSFLFDDWEGFLEKAQNNRDELDNDDRKFYQKFQILPKHFNSQYHQVLRGITYSQTPESIKELTKFIKRNPKENGAYRSYDPSRYRRNPLKLLDELEYDEEYGPYYFGLHCGSSLEIINRKIFSLNQGYFNVYKLVCELKGKNFPDFSDDGEHDFCIHLL